MTGEGNCNTTDARLIQRMVVGQLTKADLRCSARPPGLDIAITSPTTGSTTRDFFANVRGTANALVTRVEVDGIEASLESGEFQALNVPLQEGFNTITATASDALGNAITSSVSVVVDTKAPMVSIDSHAPGFTTGELTVDVAGMVNDIVVGTVNPGQVGVTVNGVQATVLNRGYLAKGVPLTPDASENVEIVAIGTDAVGNVSEPVSVSGTLEVPTGKPRIASVSGSSQIAGVGAVLPDPLVAKLTDAAGEPVAGQTVVFRVTENNGELSDGSRTASGVAVPTDSEGLAGATWTLGTRAGAGNNAVQATAVGFSGTAVFNAIALAGSPDRIVVDSGNQQTGAVGRALPRPLIAVVVDAGSNRLADVPVTFRVQKGGGRIEGGADDGKTLEVATDSDGRALAVLVLGPEPGIDNNIVSASYAGQAGFPASFVASAKLPGDPAQTSVSGVVLDNTNQPIENVTVEILDSATDLETLTDANGQFLLKPAPLGTIHVDVDGRTANRPGVWPTLEYEVVTIPGVDNPIPHPVYLLPIATENSLFVDETHGGKLEIADLPGFSLTIAPGSVKFPNGGMSGDVSVTVVHADKIPMPPGFGQQPRLIVTIQPPGAEFHPPAPITLPNVDGLKPGEVTELYSFDHDLGQFVAIGTGSVSKDGTVIASDPGVGIVRGGWHCGGNPTSTGSAGSCPECFTCAANECKPADGAACDDGNACSIGDTCAGGACVPGAPAPDGAGCEGKSDGCTFFTCQGGACVATGSFINDTPCVDDGNPCTADLCQQGTCTHPPINEGLECEVDENECTLDVCSAGTCTSVGPKLDGTICSDDGVTCTDDICTAGTCTHPVAADGTPCEGDGNDCTFDACEAGQCQTIGSLLNGTPCSDDGEECTQDVCDTAQCSHPAAPDGTACEADGSDLTADACLAGVCRPEQITDGEPCETGLFGICNEGEIVRVAGVPTCRQVNQPRAEVCNNNLDEDCNGTIDDLNVCGCEQPASSVSGLAAVSQTTAQCAACEITIESPFGNPVAQASANPTNERTFDPIADQVLVSVRATVKNADPNDLRWTIDALGSVKATWEPYLKPNPLIGRGPKATATFMGLPSRYLDFGLKVIRVNVEGGACEASQFVEIFYPGEGFNHPGQGSRTRTPNWFYYYRQNAANFAPQFSQIQFADRKESSSFPRAGGRERSIQIGRDGYKVSLALRGHIDKDKLRIVEGYAVNYFRGFWKALHHELEHANNQTVCFVVLAGDEDCDFISDDREVDVTKTDKTRACSAATLSGEIPLRYSTKKIKLDCDENRVRIFHSADQFFDAEVVAHAAGEASLSGVDVSADWACPGTNHGPQECFP